MSGKLERLLTLILTLLETPRPLAAEELRERVPGYPEAKASFHRAFERDKEALREMGVPVTIEPVPFRDPPIDGYRIRPEDYYLDDPGFTPDELAALHLAVSAVRFDTDPEDEALWKLGGVVDAGRGRPDRQLASVPVDDRLVALWTAVTERRTVTFTYRDEQRTVDPYRLDFQRGRWYLTGHDRARGEERNFRLDRLESDVGLGAAAAFDRPTARVAGGPAQPWELGEGEPTTATLLVDGAQAPWARRHLGAAAQVDERADGSAVFTVPVVNRDAFRSFVLTFLEHAEVLGPPELRADVVEWLEQQAGADRG